MEVGFLCDRNNSDTPSSQIDFIKGIILSNLIFYIIVFLMKIFYFMLIMIEKI